MKTISQSFWRFQRIVVDRLGYFQPFPKDDNKIRVVMLSVKEKIAYAQIFPFFLCSDFLFDRFEAVFRELPLDVFLSRKNPYKHAVDFVFFQTWFDLTDEQMNAVTRSIRQAWPNARLIYLDWFAPTDLRYAESLHDQVDL